MSILIKSMELPTRCAECPFEYDSIICRATGNEFIERSAAEGGYVDFCDTRMPDCPLIEVPEDVQPVKHGEWTAEGNDEYGNYWDECTACRNAVFFPPSVKNDYKYCPHCGAVMDGAE